MATSFGPSALATPANGVTVGRLLAAPFLFVMIDGTEGSWPAFILWFVLCATDGIDGFLARRHGTTRSGAFLDPLADKVLVLGAMFALVKQDVFWWLPVALIAAREIAISMYRSMAGRQGITIPARRGAKVKTVCQQFAVGFALLPWSADARWLFNTFLWIAVVLTLLTGAQYLLDARRVAARTARVSLRCEVVAVGTELLLGQVVDTNSSWIGEHLALAGIDSHFQTKVGDNRARIVSVLRLALDRSDAVIVCGGLGPTHDDITRECIAEVMGVELERHDDIAERITQMFAGRGRRMAENNLRQADVPGRRHRHPAGARHRARADLPGRRQGRLRGARRAPRDEGDAGARDHPRPPGAVGRDGGDRQSHACARGATASRAWPRPSRR